MSILMNTNVVSLNAQRNLNRSTKALGATFERLSSGLRVNSAADDAAGLAIATRMSSQIRGFNQAIRNTNDAISLVQVAEGALGETESSLQRMRELSVQAANDTLTTSDREDVWAEMIQLVSEIERIANDTEFNGQNLIGTTGDQSMKFHVGADAGKTIDMTIQDAKAATIGVDSTNVTTAASVALMDTSGAQSQANAVIGMVDTALASVSDIRSSLGALQNRLESIVDNLEHVSESTESAKSRIMDADIAAETASLTRNSILQQAGSAVLAQANAQPQIVLKLLG